MVHIEIAYDVPPLTSQVVTMAIMYRAFHGIKRYNAPSCTFIHCIWAGLAVIIISMVVVVLSATAVYPSCTHPWPSLHGKLNYGLRSAKHVRPNLGSADERSAYVARLDIISHSRASHC
ncbi:uncharacterized protein BKA55DRAFT_713438, partial [Fusarium redolens]